MVETIVQDKQFGPPKWEMEELNGVIRHRIRAGDYTGPWASYKEIAKLQIGNRTYMVCTHFFAGMLPVEKIFTVNIVKPGHL